MHTNTQTHIHTNRYIYTDIYTLSFIYSTEVVLCFFNISSSWNDIKKDLYLLIVILKKKKERIYTYLCVLTVTGATLCICVFMWVGAWAHVSIAVIWFISYPVPFCYFHPVSLIASLAVSLRGHSLPKRERQKKVRVYISF